MWARLHTPARVEQLRRARAAAKSSAVEGSPFRFQCAVTQQVYEELVALYRRRLKRMLADLGEALDVMAAGPLSKELLEVSAWHPGWELSVRPASPTASAKLAKGLRPPAGWSPAPGSRHGGYRRRRPGGGWEYWYPEAQLLVSAERRSPITPPQAVAALGDAHDQALLEKAAVVSRRLGIQVSQLAWQLGLFQNDPDPSYTLGVQAGRRRLRTLRKAEGLAAALGFLEEQDGVLVVFPDPKGDSVLIRLELPAPRDPVAVFHQIAPLLQGASIQLDRRKRAVAVVIVSRKDMGDHLVVKEVAQKLEVSYDQSMDVPCRQNFVGGDDYERYLRREGLEELLGQTGGSLARRRR